MTDWDAIVIGGGFAGTMAAREISAAGLSVLLVEGRERLGGRTDYRKFADTDSMIEMGGTYLDDSQPHIKRETARYGIDLVYPPEPERYIWNLAGTRSEEAFPVPWEEAVPAEEGLAAIRAAAARLQLEKPHCHQDIDDLDVSIEEFIDRLSVGPVTRDLLHTWASLYTGTESDRASALFHLHSIAALGGSPVALAPSLVMHSGTKSLINGIAGDIHGEVRLSTHVSSITQDAEGVTVTTSTGEELRAKRAVVALPVNTLADVTFDPPLSQAKQELARDRHAGNGYKFFALVDNVPQAVQAFGWGAPGGVTFLATDKWIGEHNLLVGFAHASDGFSPLKIDDMQRAVEEYLPEARVLAVDGFDWNQDPYARGTWMVPHPGQLTALTGAHHSDEGHLYFAGADFSLRWMTWIEGALETGHEAAQRLVMDLAESSETAHSAA
ncbi:NAD(P)/FAD-dependent oxidoreductase [Streptomyces sp. NPDC055692]|uniref:flavin monoamine oxidase family protein n=1 Tax=Streptomyces sp. NPDC055692 TaxID=3155683 RepID=UPI00343AE24A